MRSRVSLGDWLNAFNKIAENEDLGVYMRSRVLWYSRLQAFEQEKGLVTHLQPLETIFESPHVFFA